ncbi:SMR family transporter [Phenylobacterium sp.]|uniref:DMT family transporter n=1 Tax=Phenylobacterium sp. TaxID=1871053 RepID=UPI00260FDFEC|nr:SMR family transporter [Phenylobacterium sp.]
MSPKDIALCASVAIALPLGQSLFKFAALYDQRLSGPIVMRLVANWPLMAALAWYGLAAILWFYVLTRVPLSTAYAFSLVGACLVPLVGWIVFKEPASWQMGLGYALMTVGFFLVLARPGL